MQPAHRRRADEVGVRDAERIQELEEIRGHLIEGVGPRGNFGCAVRPNVVTQDAIVLRQHRGVVVPQGERRAQRMRERQHGRPGWTFEAGSWSACRLSVI